MSSVGLFEVILVMAVALLILGPDKLFTAIRYLGLLVRKLKGLYAPIADEFERQLRLDEMLKNDQPPPKATAAGAKTKRVAKAAKPTSATKLKRTTETGKAVQSTISAKRSQPGKQ